MSKLSEQEQVPQQQGGIGEQKVSLPVRLIVIGVVALLAGVCLLALIITGLALDEYAEAKPIIIDIARSLVYSYAFLIAMGGAYVLVSRMNLEQFFSPVKGWMRFLVFIVVTTLLYSPLSLVAGRAFTLISMEVNVVYSLARLAEAGVLVVALAIVLWLMVRKER